VISRKVSLREQEGARPAVEGRISQNPQPPLPWVTSCVLDQELEAAGAQRNKSSELSTVVTWEQVIFSLSFPFLLFLLFYVGI
jgi:hypothetical protein